MDPGILLVIVIIVAVFLIIRFMQSSSEQKAQQKAAQAATDGIRKLGIQQSIIKQLPTQRLYDNNDKTPGMLVLTWETLFFFRADKYLEIPVSTIRSTSSEQIKEGTNIVILADSGTFRFYWDDERRTMPGIGASGGGLGAGMAVSKSANPNVQEWIQLIDDLRFGRLKKPS